MKDRCDVNFYDDTHNNHILGNGKSEGIFSNVRSSVYIYNAISILH